MKAMPAYLYGDPCEAAIRREEKHCTGCKHLFELIDRKFCGVGRRKLERCGRFEESQVKRQ